MHNIDNNKGKYTICQAYFFFFYQVNSNHIKKPQFELTTSTPQQEIPRLLTTIPCRTMSAEEAANESAQNARLMRLASFVEENYRHKIRLADFAEKEGCSVSYLSHFIKKTMNQTFQDYVNSVRFGYACKLISEGKLSMISISMEAGFSDYRYFSRAFQEAYGMTPAEYSRKADNVITETAAHIGSAHSQELFLTRGQSLGILQEFRKRLE